MKLIHYTDKDHPLKEITYREQTKDWFKPTGLWVSDDDDWGWRDWCLDADYNHYGLDLSYEITLAKNHNVLILNTAVAVHTFTRIYVSDRNEGIMMWYIDWSLARTQYDGLIITPYLSEIRLELECMWYTTWDCAGGCIWNPAAIKRFDTCQTSS